MRLIIILFIALKVSVIWASSGPQPIELTSENAKTLGFKFSIESEKHLFIVNWQAPNEINKCSLIRTSFDLSKTNYNTIQATHTNLTGVNAPSGAIAFEVKEDQNNSLSFVYYCSPIISVGYTLPSIEFFYGNLETKHIRLRALTLNGNLQSLVMAGKLITHNKAVKYVPQLCCSTGFATLRFANPLPRRYVIKENQE